MWRTIRHVSGRKGLVLLCLMRSEIDGRVSIGHRLSFFCSVGSGQRKVQMRAVQRRVQQQGAQQQALLGDQFPFVK